MFSPVSNLGMTAFCTAVGAMNPLALRPATTVSTKPRLANAVMSVFGSGIGLSAALSLLTGTLYIWVFLFFPHHTIL